MTSCFVGFQRADIETDLVNGAVLGCEKGNPFVRDLRAYFDENLNGTHELDSFTGPGLITKLLREKGLQRYSDEPLTIDNVTIYPTRFFYPYHWEETFSTDCITQDTFAVHHWDHAWGKLPKGQIKRKILKRFNRGLARVAPKAAFSRALRNARRARLLAAMAAAPGNASWIEDIRRTR